MKDTYYSGLTVCFFLGILAFSQNTYSVETNSKTCSDILSYCISRMTMTAFNVISLLLGLVCLECK